MGFNFTTIYSSKSYPWNDQLELPKEKHMEAMEGLLTS